MTRKAGPEPPTAKSSSSTTLRFASLALVFLTIIALGAVAYFTERGIVVSRDWVIHTYQVRSQLNDLQLEIIRAHSNETISLLMHDKQELPQSREQSHLARQTVNELRRRTSDNPRQQERLAQLGDMLDENVAYRSPAGLRKSRAAFDRRAQATGRDR